MFAAIDFVQHHPHAHTALNRLHAGIADGMRARTCMCLRCRTTREEAAVGVRGVRNTGMVRRRGCYPIVLCPRYAHPKRNELGRIRADGSEGYKTKNGCLHGFLSSIDDMDDAVERYFDEAETCA